ncbi:nicotinate (nicotinamide) nucleotide adenylyltransferase [Aurantibacter aestuarii]|uniref:Probable nicotinate-nucleotide adenylyltransferase n=1 Tax=Aurantibacter aestuarii TaxID=1266046 RepID=A0A2T1ND66_9FLAO|nr:nicotinate (nicotinamide) nucleotide adenylyltransferase [Aurantibacter aestuarii]PSG90390.1 nicotinic acid mononucleotide adenylyltransferase [Aurantibacter aestuarii]
MKVGLYFGSFNPIHIGHLIIANHLVENSDLDQIWFVVTPHNPFKKKASLLDNYQRLEMVFLATKDYDKLQPCDIEFNLPQPNYTVNTLIHLKEKHPTHDFSIIMGEDNLKSFHKWKNYEVILEDYQVYVYPRISEGIVETQFTNHPKISRVDAPIIELSSTMIRNSIKAQKNVKPLLSPEVWRYIDEMGFYE